MFFGADAARQGTGLTPRFLYFAPRRHLYLDSSLAAFGAVRGALVRKNVLNQAL